MFTILLLWVLYSRARLLDKTKVESQMDAPQVCSTFDNKPFFPSTLTIINHNNTIQYNRKFKTTNYIAIIFKTNARNFFLSLADGCARDRFLGDSRRQTTWSDYLFGTRCYCQSEGGLIFF
jgi:hypothetical protein